MAIIKLNQILENKTTLLRRNCALSCPKLGKLTIFELRVISQNWLTVNKIICGATMYLFSEKKIIFCIILKTRDCITNDTAFKILHQHLEKLTNPLSIIVNQSRYGNTCRINIIIISSCLKASNRPFGLLFNKGSNRKAWVSPMKLISCTKSLGFVFIKLNSIPLTKLVLIIDSLMNFVT